MWAPLQFLLLDVRLFLWKWLSLPLPAKAGWKPLVQQVARDGLYRDAQVIGAPLAWCLLAPDAEGQLRVTDSICAVSEAPIQGAPTITVDQKSDVSHYGVRCARCGIPIHFRHSGMRTLFDVPSCPPCRRAVRRVIEEA